MNMSIIADITENEKYYGGVRLVERLRECHTPAISIALVEHGEISASCAYGVKRRNSKDVVMQNSDVGQLIVGEVSEAFKDVFDW